LLGGLRCPLTTAYLPPQTGSLGVGGQARRLNPRKWVRPTPLSGVRGRTVLFGPVDETLPSALNLTHEPELRVARPCAEGDALEAVARIGRATSRGTRSKTSARPTGDALDSAGYATWRFGRNRVRGAALDEGNELLAVASALRSSAEAHRSHTAMIAPTISATEIDAIIPSSSTMVVASDNRTNTVPPLPLVLVRVPSASTWSVFPLLSLTVPRRPDWSTSWIVTASGDPPEGGRHRPTRRVCAVVRRKRQEGAARRISALIVRCPFVRSRG
jgi:hypothetical protein